MGSSSEDGALVILQDGQSVGDIGSVVLPRHQSQFQVGAEEGGAQLGIGSGGSRLK